MVCDRLFRHLKNAREALRELTRAPALPSCFVIPPNSNVSRAMGQNSVTPSRALTPDSQVIRSWALKPRQVCVEPRQEYNFFSVMAAKRCQVRTEEEIKQLIRDKSSKSTNKATQNAVKT